MKTSAPTKNLFKKYASVKENNLRGRYIPFSQIAPLLESLSGDFKVKEVGRSVLNLPVHRVDFGTGKVKILAWSQMHGNESTTTKAVFDFFKAVGELKDDPVVSTILKNCSLRIIPMLNPDGAQAYTRVNARNIDLNRDAQDLQEPESRILKAQFDDFQPDFCLNLHDQRTIFSAGEAAKPAVLSFLTPAMDEARKIYPERIKSMQVIANIQRDLEEFLPGKIGRYDDAYNINCTGDTFQTQKAPTILFEAGHYPEDYQREQVRKYVFNALAAAMYSIATGEYQHFDFRKYEEIPENRKLFYDIIIRKALIDDKVKDIAIQYKEVLKNNKVSFLPEIVKIAPGLNFYAHREIAARGQIILFEGGSGVNENVIVNKIEVNGEIIVLKEG